MISNFHYKILEKMIDAEDNDGDYDLSPRFAPKLLDLGLIEERRWHERLFGFDCYLSGFFVTALARKVYRESVEYDQK